MNKIKIKIDVPEKELLEQCLNLGNQGYEKDALVIFMFYALAKRMHIDDFIYYVRLMDLGDEQPHV